MTLNAIKTNISLVKQAHELVRTHLKSGDMAVDATIGNGHDTKFLLDLIAPNGKVFGFDIQQTAITSTQAFLMNTPYVDSVTLICTDHAQMIEHIPTAYHAKINAVMLNLGYLPGSDKQIITQIDSTIAALSSACELLSPGGIITIIAYPGHEGGQEEAAQVKGWCTHLDREQYQTTLILSAANSLAAPMLFAVNKRC